MMISEKSVLSPCSKGVHKPLLAFSLIAMLALSACNTRSLSGLSEDANPFGGEASIPDANGIVTRGNVKYVLAYRGDNLAAIAGRAGVSVSRLANYNGVPESYIPKAGEALAIPPAPAPAPKNFGHDDLDSSISTSSLGTSTPSTHSVIAGETIFEVARLYNVTVSDLARENNLGGDLTISPGQVLNIPPKQVASNTIDTPSSTSTDADINDSPSNSESSSTQTASLGNSGTFGKPVSGSVSKGYNPASDQDGYVYSTSSQAPVQAVGDGKVVLVSESTGNQGTVVMIQHPNGLISIYGQMSNLKVSKGDQVSKGQSIGTTESSELMFQLRRGTAPVDPKDYL